MAGCARCGAAPHALRKSLRGVTSRRALPTPAPASPGLVWWHFCGLRWRSAVARLGGRATFPECTGEIWLRAAGLGVGCISRPHSLPPGRDRRSGTPPAAVFRCVLPLRHRALRDCLRISRLIERVRAPPTRVAHSLQIPGKLGCRGVSRSPACCCFGGVPLQPARATGRVALHQNAHPVLLCLCVRHYKGQNKTVRSRM